MYSLNVLTPETTCSIVFLQQNPSHGCLEKIAFSDKTAHCVILVISSFIVTCDLYVVHNKEYSIYLSFKPRIREHSQEIPQP